MQCASSIATNVSTWCGHARLTAAAPARGTPVSNPLADGFEASKAIFVTNIDLDVQEAHLRQLFGFYGELAKLKFLSYTLASPFKACLLEFKDAAAVETALMLTNTPLSAVVAVLVYLTHCVAAGATGEGSARASRRATCARATSSPSPRSPTSV